MASGYAARSCSNTRAASEAGVSASSTGQGRWRTIGPAVVGVIDEVDGAAAELAAVVEDGLVDAAARRAAAAEAGEQGGVDVHHPVGPGRGDRQQAEPAGQADQVDAGVAVDGFDGVEHGPAERGGGVVGPAVDHGRGTPAAAARAVPARPGREPITRRTVAASWPAAVVSSRFCRVVPEPLTRTAVGGGRGRAWGGDTDTVGGGGGPAGREGFWGGRTHGGAVGLWGGVGQSSGAPQCRAARPPGRSRGRAGGWRAAGSLRIVWSGERAAASNGSEGCPGRRCTPGPIASVGDAARWGLLYASLLAVCGVVVAAGRGSRRRGVAAARRCDRCWTAVLAIVAGGMLLSIGLARTAHLGGFGCRCRSARWWR